MKRKSKLSREDQVAINWFLFGLACLIILIIVINVREGIENDPYIKACKDFCEENRSERYAYYGLKRPCIANDWRECTVCFCYVDDISKQVAPYVLKTGKLYIELYGGS